MSKKTEAKHGPLSNLGEALRLLRESRGLSQSDLAAKVNLHPSAVSRYESGGSGMWVETLGRLLVGLECDARDLARQLAKLHGQPDQTTPESEQIYGSDASSESIIIASLVERVRQLSQELAGLERQRDTLTQERDELRGRLSGLDEVPKGEPESGEGPDESR